MKIWITRKQRKDGKHKITFGYDNGIRINKLYTKEKISELTTKMKHENKEVYYR